MADTKITVVKSKTDDFRRVETHIEESVQGANTQRVTTVKEEVVPMAVQKVVRETVVPVVTSRQTDTYQDGKVIATEHEVVPDQALVLNGLEPAMNSQDIAKAIEDAIRRNLPLIQNPPLPSPSPAPAGDGNVSVLGFTFDSSLIAYGFVGIMAAALVYLTVLKGWLLN